MSRSILLGLWACLMTLAAAYGAMVVAAPPKKVKTKASYFGGVDYVKAPMVGVPIIRGKKLSGYVVAQFVFTIEQKKLDALAVAPGPFLVDAAFRRLYADATADMNNMKKQDIARLLDDLKSDVNARYGKPVIMEVLVERMNFLPIDAVRAGTYATEALVQKQSAVEPSKSDR